MKKFVAFVIVLIIPFYQVAAIDATQKGKTLTNTEKAGEFQESQLKGIIPGDGTLGTAIREGTIELSHAPALIF